jgi:hypothetical protein
VPHANVLREGVAQGVTGAPRTRSLRHALLALMQLLAGATGSNEALVAVGVATAVLQVALA